MAVGSVMAGISVGIGIIIQAAVMSPAGKAVHVITADRYCPSTDSIYFMVGLVFYVLGYAWR